MAKEKFEKKEQMSLEEAKAYRASLYKPTERPLADHEKREEFRKFWAANRNKFNKPKELEEVLWIHLKAMKLDDPKKFEEGVKHFGLKKVR